jgi:DNA-3-methyladenine glycosylase I
MQLKCAWATKSVTLEKYHDEVWGRPRFDDQALFECLAVQIFQSGLDFRTILVKLPALREMFDGFEINRVAHYDQKKVEALLKCSLIIRNKRKIEAVIHNAQVIEGMALTGMSFSDFLWAKVDFVPMELKQRNNVKMMVEHPIATRICADMKSVGFRFIGPINVSFFLQASGIINAHWVNCQYQCD